MDQVAHNQMTAAAERGLNRLARAEVSLAGKDHCAFHVCGCVGAVCALALSFALSVHLGLALWLIALLAVDGTLVLVGLAMAMKILTGEERLVFFHHEIAMLVSAGLIAHAFGKPILPYLDVTALGLGIFLVCGRCGCFMVGCCHGRLAGWGVRYGREHVDAGFPACYRGVRLFPVQLAEAAGVLGIVAVGAGMVLEGAPDGAPFAWYVASQSVLRFGIEFLRGDSERRMLGSFSEPQWTALIISLAAGSLQPWSWVGSAIIAGAMVPLHFLRRPCSRLHSARHTAEIARALSDTASTGPVRIASTSLGVRISSGTMGQSTAHYAFSSASSPLTNDAAAVIARTILRLRHDRPRNVKMVAASEGGVIHLLVEG